MSAGMAGGGALPEPLRRGAGAAEGHPRTVDSVADTRSGVNGRGSASVPWNTSHAGAGHPYLGGQGLHQDVKMGGGGGRGMNTS